MEPSSASTRIDTALSNLASLIQTEETDYVGLSVAPVFPITTTTGKKWNIDVESMFRADDNTQSADGYLPEISWLDSNDSYNAKRHGRSRWVTDVDEQNADPAVKPSRGAQRISMRQNLNSLELSILTKMTDVAVFTNTSALAAGNRFSDAGASILANIDAARTACIAPGALNALLIHPDAYSAARRHPEIRNMYNYVGSGMVPPEILLEAFQVKYIFVARAKYATNNPAAAFTNGYMMPKSCLFFHLDPTPSKESMNTAWSFWLQGGMLNGAVVNPLAGVTKNPFIVKTTRDERRGDGGTHYDCAAWYDEANVMNIAPYTCYLYTTVIP